MEVRAKDGAVIVVDAGSGIRRLSNRLLSEEIFQYAFLFTHAHWDHILGFPFFKPLYSDKARLVIHGCNLHQGDMEHLLSRTMDAPYFPVPFSQIKATVEYTSVRFTSLDVGSVHVTSIPLSHPNMGLGYGFEEDGQRFVFLTDNELSHVHRGGRARREYVEFARGADLLMHDAEYLPEEYEQKRTWGHSHYIEALELALEAGVSRFGLYHHNQERTDREVDRMVEHCRSIIAERGADLECFGVSQDFEIPL